MNQIGKIQWLPEDEKHKVNAMEEDEAVLGFPMWEFWVQDSQKKNPTIA